MLDWLGDEGDRLRRAFIQEFGVRPRAFGNPSKKRGGVSDGNEGVQWNAGYDPRSGRRWVGVNLEGMKYDDWPVTRLITRELRQPTLPVLARQLGDTIPACVEWVRDYWQATARPPIVERYIAPTPLLLSRLSEELWREALEGALACLDPKRNWRGRATREVTLVVGDRKVMGQVSPHLTLLYPVTTAVSWPEFIPDARARLQPLYDWAVKSTA